MTTGGWITMLLSVGAVVALFIFCLVKVILGGPAEADHLHGMNIDTKDTDEN